MRITWLSRAVSAAALALAAGCHSTYYAVQFVPATNEVPAIVPARDDAKARSLVSIRGVKRADKKSGAPEQVDIRMRIENLGQVPCTLEQHTLQLLSGDLEPFGAAQVNSSDPPVIAPGATSNFELYFPMPNGKKSDNVSFKSLNLRWTLDFDGQAMTNGATFERAAYRDPYWDEPHFQIGVGGVFHSH
jgi:hypothetical protein